MTFSRTIEHDLVRRRSQRNNTNSTDNVTGRRRSLKKESCMFKLQNATIDHWPLTTDRTYTGAFKLKSEARYSRLAGQNNFEDTGTGQRTTLRNIRVFTLILLHFHRCGAIHISSNQCGWRSRIRSKCCLSEVYELPSSRDQLFPARRQQSLHTPSDRLGNVSTSCRPGKERVCACWNEKHPIIDHVTHWQESGCSTDLGQCVSAAVGEGGGVNSCENVNIYEENSHGDTAADN